MKTLIIALANQKGGVGKTTTAINFSACLAEEGKKVLLIDLDPQANATSGLGIDKVENDSIFSALLGEATGESKIKETSFTNLDIIPSELDLAGAEIAIAKHDDYLHKLQKALKPVVDSNKYNFIILDCPPSLGILFMNALNVANEVIIPMQCEYLALEGLGVMANIVDKVAKAGNYNLKISGILMTMYNPTTNLSQQVVQEVIKHFDKLVFETIIPRNVRLSEAPSFGLPINKHDTQCIGATAYRSLAKEFIDRQKTKLIEQIQKPSLDEIPPSELSSSV